MAGRSAPHVRAIVELDDRFTPGLKRLLETLASVAVRMAEVGGGFQRSGAALQPLVAHLREIEALSRSAFDAAGVRRFTGGVDAAGNATATLGRRLKTVREEAHALAGAMKTAADFAAMAAGVKVQHAGVAAVRAGATAQQTETALRSVLPRGEAGKVEFDAAKAHARKISNEFPSTTYSEALKDYQEGRSIAVTGDPKNPTVDQERLAANMRVVALARANLAAAGEPFTASDARHLFKAVELSGNAGDPDAVRKMFEAFVKTKKLAPSSISAEAVETYASNAKASNFSRSDPAFYDTAMIRITQSNAARLGNSEDQTLKSLFGGRMTKQSAQYAARLGLLKQEQIVDGKGGKFYIKGNIAGSEVLSSDATAWANNFLVPAMAKSGDISEERIAERVKTLRDAELRANPNAKPNQHVLEEKATHALVADSLAKSGLRGTVGDYLAHAIGNSVLIARDIGLRNQMPGLEEGAAFEVEGVVSGLKRLEGALETFASVATSPAMGDASDALARLTKWVSSVAEDWRKFSEESPATAKALAIGVPATAVVGGAGLTVFGVTSLLASGPKLIAAALALDGAAVALSTSAGAKGVAGAVEGAAAATAAEGATTAGAAAAATATGAAAATGAAPAAVVAGGYLGALGGAAALALNGLNRLGKSEWSFGRLFHNVTYGQDRTEPKAVVDREIDRRIAARQQWNAEQDARVARGEPRQPFPDDVRQPPAKPPFWLDREFWFGKGLGPGISTGKYALPGKPGDWSQYQIERREAVADRHDRDSAPDASAPRVWGVRVGGPMPWEAPAFEGKLDAAGERIAAGAEALRAATSTPIQIQPSDANVNVAVTFPEGGPKAVAAPATIHMNTGSQSSGSGSTLASGHRGRGDL